MGSFLERFFKKIEVTRGCWFWKAAKNSGGYGSFGIGGKMYGAHRLSYEIHRGFIPQGLELDHLCRNRVCCNPFHLEPVTRRENVRRGISPPAIYMAKEKCSFGHEYSRGSRQRVCRVCESEYRKKRYRELPRVKAWRQAYYEIHKHKQIARKRELRAMRREEKRRLTDASNMGSTYRLQSA